MAPKKTVDISNDAEPCSHQIQSVRLIPDEFRLFKIPLESRKMATENASEKKTTKTKDWLNKVDQASIGDLRKKYPTAFWIVGGVVLLSLIL